MEDPGDKVAVTAGGGEEEEFGFVERDCEVLEKALTRNDPSPAGGDDNAQTGSEEEQQVSSSPAAGSDEPDEDVTSVPTALESIREDDTHSGQEDADEYDGFNFRKLGGTLKDSPEIDKLGAVYDASKRKATVATIPSTAPLQSKQPGPGILRKMQSGMFSSKQTTEATPASKEDELPQNFQVKYLGQRDARGLWGIKHTRRPVDSMVAAAKNLKPGTVLPIVKLVVSKEGVTIVQLMKGGEDAKFHPIDTISYGVQDLVYTRVFSMIVVRETGDMKGQHPFECHAFVCDSRNGARKLTYALASAFHEYSKLVKARGSGEEGVAAVKKKFAIDLRSPEEIEADLKSPHPEDSEA